MWIACLSRITRYLTIYSQLFFNSNTRLNHFSCIKRSRTSKIETSIRTYHVSQLAWIWIARNGCNWFNTTCYFKLTHLSPVAKADRYGVPFWYLTIVDPFRESILSVATSLCQLMHNWRHIQLHPLYLPFIPELLICIESNSLLYLGSIHQDIVLQATVTKRTGQLSGCFA